MSKIVFIGAGSGFGAVSFTDLMSFPALQDSEVVLVDINPDHLGPVADFCRKVVEHYQAPTRVSTALNWRDGVLDGADYVITSFAQGGPAYSGVPFHHETSIPRQYGIYQYVADTAGIGGVFRTMRTGPELLAIARDMEMRCPGAYLLNYVNPMSMLTRALTLAAPKVQTLGLCHNIQHGIRDIARWIGCTHKELRYTAAGVNHMDWFLRLEYLDGRNAYPDLAQASEQPEIFQQRCVQFELLKHFGYFSTESAGHCAEYLPYFMPRESGRTFVWPGRTTQAEVAKRQQADAPRVQQAKVAQVAKRWQADSPLVQQTAGTQPLELTRTFEYGVHIIHALETDTVHRMHLNVLNTGLITNLPDNYCVEVPCSVDRTGVHAQYVGALPIPLAALCRGMADMQTLASDALLEVDLHKAFQACCIDPNTAASAMPAQIRACFDELLKAEEPWLAEYWGTA